MKRWKYLVCFFGLMLFFTMLSRGIYAHKMARVTLGKASSKSLTRTLSAEGLVEAARETAVVVPEGVRIREVCVKAGERIDADTVLLILDEADLDRQIQRLEEQIQVAQAKAGALGGQPGNLLEQQLTVRDCSERLTKFKKLRQKDGQVCCGQEGYLTKVLVRPGDRTPDSASMLFADASGGSLQFRAELTKEQAQLLTAGDTVQLQLQNGKLIDEACLVRTVRQSAGGAWEAVTDVSAQEAAPGERGVLEMTAAGGRYDCCVPLTALHTDGQQYYVLLIREVETILGKELSVVRKNVTVRDQNDSFAALADGAVGAEEQVVVYADKKLQSQDKVRLFEEGEERMDRSS